MLVISKTPAQSSLTTLAGMEHQPFQQFMFNKKFSQKKKKEIWAQIFGDHILW